MKQFWYQAPKEGQKYASIGCSGWSEANSTIIFDELVYCQDDGFYYIFAYATKVTELQNFGNKDWKFEPQLLTFKVAKKDYEKQDKERKTVKVQQSRLERWLCHTLSELEEGLAYKGWINLKDDPSCDYLVTKNLNGVPIDGAIYQQMLSMNLEIEALTEPPKHINVEEDVKPPSGKGGFGKGGYGAKSQTEAEKLADRLAFVLGQVNQASDIKVENVGQLASLVSGTDSVSKELRYVFDLCVALMV